MFDLLGCEGYDLRGVTLAERKKTLRTLLPRSERVRYVDSLSEQGEAFFRQVCQEDLEGIVAKDLNSTYRSGQRSRRWLKIKCRRELPDSTSENNPQVGDFPYSFLSNPDKVFWPQQGYTKADLLVTYLQDRPMVLERFPDGIEGKSFYQKNAPEFLPDWIPTLPVRSDSANRTIHFILCNDRDTLVYLANLACISMHPWSSRAGNLDCPDFMIVDLDPDEKVPFSTVCRVAHRVREVLGRAELPSYPKTSGATGIHILVPLEPKYSYEEVRTFAEIVARLSASAISKATAERSMKKRRGKVYIDFLQNGRGKTIVSPYCVRPVAAASVSMPLDWEEVTPRLRPEAFHIKNAFRRLERRGDLWEGLFRNRQSLNRALQKFEDSWGGSSR